MSTQASTHLRWLDRAQDALGLLVPLLPLLLIHARSVADGLLSALAVLWLLDALLRRDVSRFAHWTAVAPLLWWLALVLATLMAAPERIGTALAVLRLPLAVLALGQRGLADPEARRRLALGLGLAVAWVVLEVWLQFAFGRGITGHARWGAGELPGPFARPRAGGFLSRAAWPVLLPLVASGLARGRALRVGAFALPALLLATLAIIGQRLPFVFGLFGAGLSALLLPGLRLPAILGGVAGALGLGATALVAPHAADRMVGSFLATLAAFGDSHYGQILARALAIHAAHPWTGAGIDGFRALCASPRFFQGWEPGSDGGGASICVTHPHNPYLQALVDAGWPGLVLFALAALAWLVPITRVALLGEAARRPLRAGLLVALVVHLWPIASTSSFTAQPLMGLFVLLAGWALAEAREDQGTRG